jgi:hypothetical protein
MYFQVKITFKKQLQPHNYQTFYTYFFATFINFNYNFYQTFYFNLYRVLK